MGTISGKNLPRPLIFMLQGGQFVVEMVKVEHFPSGFMPFQKHFSSLWKSQQWNTAIFPLSLVYWLELNIHLFTCLLLLSMTLLALLSCELHHWSSLLTPQNTATKYLFTECVSLWPLHVLAQDWHYILLQWNLTSFFFITSCAHLFKISWSLLVGGIKST